MRPKKSSEQERDREGEKLKEKVDVVQVALRTAKLTRLRLLFCGRAKGGGATEVVAGRRDAGC